MKPQWLSVLGCLCILASPGRAMVVPTQDTMVVARSDDGTSAANTDATSASATEAATEGPVPPIKLTDMDVTSTVALRYAHTAVVTSVRNPAAKAQEATFRVLLPETAFISGFTMTLDGKSYKAYVKEKEEAKQIYDQAVSQGLGAAHIATKARDSNQFTVSVNVEPNSVAVFNLTYEELLVRRNGVYNHAINLHPGALVPKLTVTVNIKEAQKISTLRVPEIRTGNEIDATEDDAQNTKAIIERGNNDREAKVVFKPDLQEQERLIEIYREKTKENRPSHSSFSYGYATYEDEDKKQIDGVLGQFVVQYDVERPKDGEILVNDGYFVHFFAPSDLPPLSKHVVFVLDTSGSMMGRKIEQLRQAMQTILSELNQGDYFSIVEFASTVKVYEMSEADKEPSTQNNYYDYYDYDKKTRLVPPALATPENVAKAKVIVSRLNASGGTNIYSALNVAIDLIKKGIGWTAEPADEKTTEVVQQETATASTAAATSAAASAATSAATSAVTNAAASAVTSATTSEVAEGSEASKLEPIIIFLTDGDPTVGVTDQTRITNHLTEKNTGFNKATIFSLAFGEDADRKFLRKLSLRNDGFMRHIYEAADAALQLREFYRQVSSPLLADVKFIYPKKQVKEGSVTKHQFRRYYSGSETVVAGVLEPSAEELTPQVLAFCGVLDGPGRKRLEILPKAPEAAKKGDKYLPLERLWAHLTVKQLLDERDAADQDADQKSKEDSPEKKALALALKYEFVTPLTSLVVVKPNATDNVNAESVDKQVPKPPQSVASLVGGRRRGQTRSRSHSSHLMYLKPLRHGSTTNLLDNATPTHDSGPQGVAIMAQYFPAAPGLPGPPAYASAGFGGGAGGSLPLSYHMAQSYRPSAISGFLSPGQPLFDSVPDLNSADFAAEPLEEESLIDYMPDNTGTTQLDRVALTTTLRPRPNSLAVYNLLEFDWIQPLVADDAVTLQVNSSTVTLKLAKDDVPKPATGVDPECAAATDGAPGVCVYLTRCDAARTITAQAYSNTYCVVSDKYAGVCCPKTSVDVGTPTPQP